MERFKRTAFVSVMAGGLLVLVTSPLVFSHCEIPCGIYDDQMRLDMMAEHIATIEKSIKQINELSAPKDKNYNQLVRWVMNKESHADHLSDIVTQYFMKQRIKPAEKHESEAYEQYVRRLTLLHNVMIYAMKCKQTTDLANVEQLKSLLGEFRAAYLGPSDSGQHEHEAHKHG